MKYLLYSRFFITVCLLIFLFENAAPPLVGATLKRIENLWGGDVSALAVDANDKLYATAAGKLFGSLNNGDEWIQINVGDGEAAVRHVIAYRGADEVDYIVVGTDEGRLLRSANGGLNWRAATPAFDKDSITALIHILPDNIMAAMAREGLVRTTGHDFDLISMPVEGIITAMTQVSDGSLLVATKDPESSGPDNVRLLRSDNGGADWEAALPDPFVKGIIAMQTFKADGMVYAAVEPYGVMISQDDGQTWALDTVLYPRQPISALEPGADGELYAGTTNGLYVIREQQDEPELLSATFDYTTVRALAVTTQGAVFAATQGGVTRRTDKDSEWQNVNFGLDAVEARQAVNLIDNDFDGRFIASPSGIYRRCIDTGPDCDEGWRRVKAGLPQNADVHSIAVLNAQDAILYAGINADIYRSIDNGATWSRAYESDDRYVVSEFGGFCRDFYTNAGVEFAIAGPKLLATIDSGKTWKERVFDPDRETTFTAISNRDCSGGPVYVGTAASGIFQSLDDGVTWEPVAPDVHMTTVIRTYGCTNEFIAAVLGGGVFSADDGWSKIKIDDDNPHRSTTIHEIADVLTWPLCSVIAGTDDGVYYMPHNFKGEWELVDLAGIPIIDIDVLSGGGFSNIFIRGMFCAGKLGAYTYDVVISAPEQPASEPLAIWPVPATTVAHISYTMAQFGFVEMEIFTSLGQPVARLIEEYREAGSHTHSFSVAGLSAGMYTYRLRAGNNQFFGSITVIR